MNPLMNQIRTLHGLYINATKPTEVYTYKECLRDSVGLLLSREPKDDEKFINPIFHGFGITSQNQWPALRAFEAIEFLSRWLYHETIKTKDNDNITLDTLTPIEFIKDYFVDGLKDILLALGLVELDGFYHFFPYTKEGTSDSSLKRIELASLNLDALIAATECQNGTGKLKKKSQQSSSGVGQLRGATGTSVSSDESGINSSTKGNTLEFSNNSLPPTLTSTPRKSEIPNETPKEKNLPESMASNDSAEAEHHVRWECSHCEIYNSPDRTECPLCSKSKEAKERD